MRRGFKEVGGEGEGKYVVAGRWAGTMEPRYNESLYNEVLGKTNNFLYPSNDKIYGKEPCNSEQILLVSRPFLISRFYCRWLDFELSFSVSRVKARQDWRERNDREYMVFSGRDLWNV